MVKGRTGLPPTLIVLLLGVALMHVADYLVIPILPVILRSDRGFAAWQVGAVLSVTSLLFLSGSLLGGTLSDRVGRRTVMFIGAGLRFAGILGLGLLSSLSLLFLAAALSGLGAGFFAPALKAAIAAIASGEHRTTAFSWRGIAANFGVGSAGLLALILARAGSQLVFFVAAGIQVVLALSAWLLIPKECENQVRGEDCPAIRPGAVGEALRNRPFLAFGAASFLMWALYSQLALALPLRASVILPNAKTVGLIWSINSAVVILLQNVMTRYMIKRMHPITAMVVGTLLLGGGLTAAGFATGFPTLSVSAVVFIFGEMLILPTYDAVVSQLAPPAQVGIFFGLANFVSGMGESLGNLLGGQLLERGKGALSVTPWAVYGGYAVVVAAVLTVVRNWTPLRIALRQAAADPNAPGSAPKVKIDRPDWNLTSPEDRTKNKV